MHFHKPRFQFIVTLISDQGFDYNFEFLKVAGLYVYKQPLRAKARKTDRQTDLKKKKLVSSLIFIK